MAVTLTSYIRPLQGGSRPHLMGCPRGERYIVKCRENPQGSRVLVNELFAALLGSMLGLSIPGAEVVHIPPGLVEKLRSKNTNGCKSIEPGLHVGSHQVISHLEGRTFDCFPRQSIRLLRNPDQLIGIKLFDWWVCNRDIRQSLFWKRCRERKYTVSFIDNGHCFGGPEWDRLSDTPAMPPLTDGSHLDTARMWVFRISTLSLDEFRIAASKLVPEEWRISDYDIETLCEFLAKRQAVITAFLPES